MKPLDPKHTQDIHREDPLLKIDDSDMMASMEEQLWAIEAGVEPQSQGGLMGMKLELPPLRKGAGAPGIKAKYNPDRQRTLIGDRSRTPITAQTPTRELEQPTETPEGTKDLVSRQYQLRVNLCCNC